MKFNFFEKYVGGTCIFILLLALVLCHVIPPNESMTYIWLLPLDTGDRADWNSLLFEPDAHFLTWRAGQGKIRPHYHTGVDMQNGGDQGQSGGPGEHVYAMAKGVVLGIFDSMPYQRVVIEHRLPEGETVWSSYLHIANPTVEPGQWVDPFTIIGRRMIQRELDRYGWEFNHVHVEILKKLPPKQGQNYNWMSLRCYTKSQVQEYFYDPRTFLMKRLGKNGYY